MFWRFVTASAEPLQGKQFLHNTYFWIKEQRTEEQMMSYKLL